MATGLDMQCREEGVKEDNGVWCNGGVWQSNAVLKLVQWWVITLQEDVEGLDVTGWEAGLTCVTSY